MLWVKTKRSSKIRFGMSRKLTCRNIWSRIYHKAMSKRRNIQLYMFIHRQKWPGYLYWNTSNQIAILKIIKVFDNGIWDGTHDHFHYILACRNQHEADVEQGRSTFALLEYSSNVRIVKRWIHWHDARRGAICISEDHRLPWHYNAIVYYQIGYYIPLTSYISDKMIFWMRISSTQNKN